MKEIWIISDDMDESDTVFDKEGNVIGGWHWNDAKWRSEYFNGVFKKLGIKVHNSVNTHPYPDTVQEGLDEGY